MEKIKAKAASAASAGSKAASSAKSKALEINASKPVQDKKKQVGEKADAVKEMAKLKLGEKNVKLAATFVERVKGELGKKFSPAFVAFLKAPSVEGLKDHPEYLGLLMAALSGMLACFYDCWG